MKTLKVSDEVHVKLTGVLGTLMAQTNKMQTCHDAIAAMLNQSAILPAELLSQIESFVEENKRLGFTNKEGLMRDTIRVRLAMLKSEC